MKVERTSLFIRKSFITFLSEHRVPDSAVVLLGGPRQKVLQRPQRHPRKLGVDAIKRRFLVTDAPVCYHRHFANEASRALYYNFPLGSLKILLGA